MEKMKFMRKKLLLIAGVSILCISTALYANAKNENSGTKNGVVEKTNLDSKDENVIVENTKEKQEVQEDKTIKKSGETEVKESNSKKSEIEVNVQNTKNEIIKENQKTQNAVNQNKNENKNNNIYTLKFDATGGTVSEKCKNLMAGSSFGTLPTPTRTGYTFNGWFTAASGGSQITSTTTMGAGNTTVYAHWTANPISFKLTPTTNGGLRPIGNPDNFNALYGMTWQEFVNSSYNNNSAHKIIISGNYVKMKETGGEYYVFKQATGSNSMPAALKTDTISDGFNYILDFAKQAKPSN